ncbi:hypothetical protein JCM10212_002347 [Sporobolomyces blumeae]
MSTSDDVALVAALQEPLELPCGRIVPNRLVKAAMEELMSIDLLPNDRFARLYEQWARGGWGMIISGNVQINPRHLGLPLDVAVPISLNSPEYRTEALPKFKAWSASMRRESDQDKAPLCVMQLNHPGRQSMRFLTGRSWFAAPLAPSRVPMSAGTGSLGRLAGRVVWGRPKEMDEEDLASVVKGFRRGANLASEAGWDGVQLHASHGYLLAQFLSPRTNLRQDAYGNSARNRLRLLFEVVDAIRQDRPIESGFVVGVKLNASDYINGGLTEEDALENVKWIAEHGGFDFIEISGGSYEAPQFLSMKRSSREREAFFSGFSARAFRLLDNLNQRNLPTRKPAILLTGGFRNRAGMARALGTRDPSQATAVTDLVGVARPAAVDPAFASKMLDPALATDDAALPDYEATEGTSALRWLFSWMTLFGPSLDVFYHTMLMQLLALPPANRRDERAEVDAKLEKEDDPTAVRARLMPFWTLFSRVYLEPLAVLPLVKGIASTIAIAALAVLLLPALRSAGAGYESRQFPLP